MRTKLLATLTAVAFLFTNCEKENAGDNECQAFQVNVFNKNSNALSLVFHDGLHTYNRKDLEAIAARIAESCNIKATLICYNCIYTLPAQSEMKIEFTYAGAPVVRVLDISYTNENLIKIVRVHE